MMALLHRMEETQFMWRRFQLMHRKPAFFQTLRRCSQRWRNKSHLWSWLASSSNRSKMHFRFLKRWRSWSRKLKIQRPRCTICKRRWTKRLRIKAQASSTRRCKRQRARSFRMKQLCWICRRHLTGVGKKSQTWFVWCRQWGNHWM